MLAANLAVWVLRHQVRSPALWLWGAVFAATWPAVTVFTPLGVTTSMAGTPPLLYEIAFLASLVGQTAGIAQIEGSRWILGHGSAARRAFAEWIVLVSASLPFLAAALLPPLLLGARDSFGWGSLIGSATTLLHLSAIALVLVRLPISGAARLAALPVFAWVLPALVHGESTLGIVLLHVFDAARHVQDPDLAGWTSAVLPIIGLLGAAFVSSRTSIPHAIRNPR
ncbi:MAG: hypothetical protein GY711_20305 [bacterium]|nr:hypothetical protein [bacterium]